MKTTLKTICLLCIGIALLLSKSKAQKVEVSAGLNTGFFNFNGAGTNSDIYFYSPYYSGNVIENKYSRRLTFSYGATLQAQFVHKSGFLIGLQAGYDLLRNKSIITEEYSTPGIPYDNYTPIYTPAKGYNLLTAQFLNLNPFLGYRIKGKKIKIDITGGVDAGISLDADRILDVDSPEHIHGSSGTTVPSIDWRIKGGIALHYNRWGINTSYAHGVTDYTHTDSSNQQPPISLLLAYTDYDFVSTKKVYSQVFKLGLTYQLL